MSKRDASCDLFPTPERHRELIDAATKLANLLPPGDDRAQFLGVARSLHFLIDSAVHNDCQQAAPLRGRRYSITREPNNVVEISKTSAVLHEIQRTAEKENVPLRASYHNVGEACTQGRRSRIKLSPASFCHFPDAGIAPV